MGHPAIHQGLSASPSPFDNCSCDATIFLNQIPLLLFFPPPSVLLDQELLQRHCLCSGRTLPARQWLLNGGSAHRQPLLEGEAPVQADQAGLPAGGRRVLRRRYLEHLVRPRPHRGRPRHGQGTGVDCRG